MPGPVGDAGGVEQPVDALQRRDQPAPALRIRDIEMLVCAGGDVGCDHRGAVAAQDRDRRGADPAGRAGHDNGLALEPHGDQMRSRSRASRP